jgi:sialate O-acetylesterase
VFHCIVGWDGTPDVWARRHRRIEIRTFRRSSVPMSLLRHSACVLLVLVALTVRADVSLPKILGDHMVLQRDRAVPVWGHAAPGEKITVRFATQEKSTDTGADGRWQISLDSLVASATPRDLTVAGSNTLTLHDLLVGEVWLCSGQSNMEMAVGTFTAGAQPESASDPALAEEIKTAAYPTLRLFRVEKKHQPPDVVSDGWTECRGEALARFSAASFFFGRELHQTLGVPVGLIESNWGGSRIEEWISDAAYAPLEKILGTDVPPTFERDAKLVSRDYDDMLEPLVPFALRGVLWYQGESQIIAYHDGLRYADKMNTLVTSWRAVWSQPDLPFYSVQLAPFYYSKRKDPLTHADDELPKLWEAQLRATAIARTGLVPITDTVDDLANIHPGKKSVVGHRLASLALADTYGRKNVAASFPVFDHLEIKGATAVVHFRSAGGLTTRDGKSPTDFEIAGADGQFVAATATIRGDTVEVSSPRVAASATVRFGWHETARPNLQNRAGWPAYPFRSDGPAWRHTASAR